MSAVFPARTERACPLPTGDSTQGRAAGDEPPPYRNGRADATAVVQQALHDRACADGPGLLYVGFGGHQVAVASNAPEVLAALARGFRHMLEPAPIHPVATVEVRAAAGAYELLGGYAGLEGDGSLDEALRCARHAVIRRLIEARPDLLFFHAGASAQRDRAVMIAGTWGRGKSTIVTSLSGRGWGYLSDDVVAFDPGSGCVLPFPLTPVVREGPAKDIPVDQLPTLRKAEVDLGPAALCREPARLAAIVFPAYCAHVPTALAPCPPAAAALDLLQSCLNAATHGERAVEHICGLVGRLPVYRLSFRSGKRAASLIARAHAAG